MFFNMISYSKMNFLIQKYNIFSAKPVNSEEEARQIGEYLAHKLYDGSNLVDFGRYEKVPQVDDDGEMYSVWYRLYPRRYIVPNHIPLPNGEPRERLEYSLGGGGPQIEIEKSTGKILDWGLQK